MYLHMSMNPHSAGVMEDTAVIHISRFRADIITEDNASEPRHIHHSEGPCVLLSSH